MTAGQDPSRKGSPFRTLPRGHVSEGLEAFEPPPLGERPVALPFEEWRTRIGGAREGYANYLRIVGSMQLLWDRVTK